MKRETLKTIWQMGWKITLGSAIFALGFDLFLEPNNLNVGGMSGLAMVLRELLGFGQIGVITMLLNVPLFILGAKKLGRKFLFGSLSGMLLSSVFIDLFAFIPAPKFCSTASMAAFSSGLASAWCSCPGARRASPISQPDCCAAASARPVSARSCWRSTCSSSR